jgi:hypothetical protein
MPIVTLMPLEPIADLDTFRAALRQALDARTKNLDVIAAAAGFESAGSVTDWAGGRVKSFDPAKVFALEKALGCHPGELSTHLGYLPLSAAGTVEAAIIRSGDLDPQDRAYLLKLYRDLRRQHERSQGSPARSADNSVA